MVVEMGEKAPHSGGRERVKRTVTGASAVAGDLSGGGGAGAAAGDREGWAES